MFIEKKKQKKGGGDLLILLYLQQLCLINLLYIEYVEYKYEKKKTTRTQHNKTQRAELNSILHFYYPGPHMLHIMDHASIMWTVMIIF